MTRPRVRHGAGRSADPECRRLYWVWKQLRQRCKNPHNKDWRNYGALGVDVYPPWDASFVEFRRYVHTTLGPKPTSAHSLDRIDPTRGYAPGNLRWASRAEQSRNKRPRPTTVPRTQEAA